MHRSGPCFNHCLHKLESIEVATKSRFCIGNDDVGYEWQRDTLELHPAQEGAFRLAEASRFRWRG